MPTWSAFTRLAGRDRAEALGAALEALVPDAVGVIELEDGSGTWEVAAYFDAAPGEVELALLAAAHGARDFVVSDLPETDWVAKVRRDLAPVRAGRFLLHGSHDADRVPEGAVALLIDAAMAFGTGHHGTTRGCLEAFDALLSRGAVRGPVADVGCGTAVLAMAAARVLPGPVVAGDNDPQAVEVAGANVRANGLDARIACVEAQGFEHPAFTEAAPFGLVFGNILKGPLIDLAPVMAGHLAPGGHAILSGLLTPQAGDVLAAYRAAGLEAVSRLEIGEWSTLTLSRPTD